MFCKHYKRNCYLVAPCCNKNVKCRLCHDEENNHKMDRYAVKFVVCHKCGLKQKKQAKCEQCDICFGEYFCEICSLYETSKRNIHHCDKCNMCLVGLQEEFFHCNTCESCFLVKNKKNHKCIPKVFKTNWFLKSKTLK